MEEDYHIDMEIRNITYWTIRELVHDELSDWLKQQLKNVYSLNMEWVIYQDVTDTLSAFSYLSIRGEN